MKKAAIVICGAGIIGLTIARELVKRSYNNILIIDKEDGPGKHASGRNSGVLHAGIYYTPNTMRAKSCLAGNFMVREYCKEKGLPLIEAGKVIVTKNEEELPILKELYHRATENGAKVELVDEKELAEIEPNAKRTFSPPPRSRPNSARAFLALKTETSSSPIKGKSVLVFSSMPPGRIVTRSPTPSDLGAATS